MNIIRNYAPADKHEVELMLQEAFNNLYEPGCNEHLLASNLRKSESIINDLDLVMEVDGQIIGTIMFSKAKLTSDKEIIDTITVSPFCIMPAFQAKGYGKQLMNEALKRAKEMGYKHVFLYGYPEIYINFGFKQAGLYRICAAENVYPTALHVYELEKGILKNEDSMFSEDFYFDTDPDELEEFNRNLPNLPKLKLDCQVKFEETLNSFVDAKLIGSAFEN